MFQHLAPLPADPILGLSVLFRKDANPDKVDLGVGIYKDTRGRTPIPGAVQAAYERIVGSEGSKAYISPTGWPGFTDGCKDLVLGADLGQKLKAHVGAIQTPGGCGALRLGFDLIRHSAPDATVWVSNPTWANHVPTIKAAGLKVATYRYYDKASATTDVDAMLADLDTARAGDVVLLHAACHNPTGADLKTADWKAVRALLARKGLIPFLDMAYQGFSAGLDDDAAPARAMFDELPEVVLSYSCSKNFGLYRERTGALMVKGENPGAADALLTNLAQLARANYSMPPAHGAALVSMVLEDEALNTSWRNELEAMRVRLVSLRAGLASALMARDLPISFAAVGTQAGMFSLLNISEDQVARLMAENSIYMPSNGRINIAGLTTDNIPYVADAIAGVVNS